MIQKNWFEGPNWLLNEEDWPNNPEFKSSTKTREGQRKIEETFLFTKEKETDEWDKLLEWQSYWRALRTTSWCLRFTRNCIAKKRKEKLTKGPLTTEEIMRARDHFHFISYILGGWPFSMADFRGALLKITMEYNKIKYLYLILLYSIVILRRAPRKSAMLKGHPPKIYEMK